MVKGTQARRKSKPPVVSTRESKRTSVASETGVGASVAIEDTCWDFKLVKITAAGQQVAKNVSVSGQIIGSRVIVLSARKDQLGEAPESKAGQIIKAYR